MLGDLVTNFTSFGSNCWPAYLLNSSSAFWSVRAFR